MKAKKEQNKDKGAISYDAVSQSYDSLHNAEQNRKYAILLSMIEMKKEDKQEKDKLLDVACGTGMFFEFLESEKIQCYKTGIDNSQGMIEKCKKKGFNCQISAAENLPFADKSFDIVTCISAIHNFKDPGNALFEMRRVCKNSGSLGIIVITVLRRSEKYEEICDLIKKNFKIEKKIEEQKDDIFVLRINHSVRVKL